MADPIFILCQGRSGGTALADALAQLPGCVPIIEPFHPRLAHIIAENPVRTDPKLAHRIRPYPFEAYLAYDRTELLRLWRARAQDPAAFLRFLAAHPTGRPVIKLTRLLGRRAAVRRACGAEATVIHLQRDRAALEASRARAGMTGAYFGEEGGPALAYRAAATEARELADVNLSYEYLMANKFPVLGALALLLGYEVEEGFALADAISPRGV